jgi:putative transposase
MTKHSPFRYFKTNPDIIRLAVMLFDLFLWSLSSVDAKVEQQREWKVEQQREWSNLHDLCLHTAPITLMRHLCSTKGTTGAGCKVSLGV